jgi:hypothetical protein
MEKLTTMLSAHDRVILFCVATATDCSAVGITAHAMQSMAIRGFIAHNREETAAVLGSRPSLSMSGFGGNKKTATAMTGGREFPAVPACRLLGEAAAAWPRTRAMGRLSDPRRGNHLRVALASSSASKF